jgi:hypothetical protein
MSQAVASLAKEGKSLGYGELFDCDTMLRSVGDRAAPASAHCRRSGQRVLQQRAIGTMEKGHRHVVVLD